MIKKTDHSKKPTERYIEAVGSRKTALARVRIFSGGKGIFINDKDLKQYFSVPKYQEFITAPLKLVGLLDQIKATVKVIGGGVNAQAEAVRHGLAKALVLSNSQYKNQLRLAGFLTRDARMVERKKYGLKKARRAPQWAKR